MPDTCDTMRHGSRLRIAVAEDETLLRDFYSMALTHLGHEVVAVTTNGEELVKVCDQMSPDLIISDVELPGMTGPEAVAVIRRKHPVAAIYVTETPGEDEACSNADRGVVLAKPFMMSDLTSVIQQAMATKPSCIDQSGCSPQWR